jgi:response regulator RpfG family c-di-GMP phosphodiesterase
MPSPPACQGVREWLFFSHGQKEPINYYWESIISDKEKILFVDDEAHFLSDLRRLLRKQRDVWDIHFAQSVDEALDKTHQINPDVIVTDVAMPIKTGFDLLRELKSEVRTADIPVIVLTGSGERELKVRALDTGATDLLNKPVIFEDLIARIRNALRLKAYQDELKNQNAILDRKVKERTRELEESHRDIAWRLAKAGEYRDEETGNHIVRVGCYCQILAKGLGMDDSKVDMLMLTAPLHDIGKIGIPDAILLKPGKLDADEWEVMRCHSIIGANILKDDPKGIIAFLEWKQVAVSETSTFEKNPVINMAATIARSHHEKWDGSGYPSELSGEKIPLEGRITAVADVYDALRSVRPYKPAFSEEKTMQIIQEGAGSHFDPGIVAVFERNLTEFREVYTALSDHAVH